MPRVALPCAERCGLVSRHLKFIRSDNIEGMSNGELLRRARRQSGLTLAELAARAKTSAPTLSRYESGHIDPSGAVVDRILAAAGFEAEFELRPLMTGPRGSARSEEIEAVLELAEQFPARHDATLDAPIFGRAR